MRRGSWGKRGRRLRMDQRRFKINAETKDLCRNRRSPPLHLWCSERRAEQQNQPQPRRRIGPVTLQNRWRPQIGWRTTSSLQRRVAQLARSRGRSERRPVGVAHSCGSVGCKVERTREWEDPDRTPLVAKGKNSWTLLGAQSNATRSKDATRGSWPYY